MAHSARQSPQMSRAQAPVADRDGVAILDIDRYLPFLLNAVSSAWQRKTSAIYRTEFGFRVVEWRVVAMLNIEPKITANRICEVLRLDKGVASRSLKHLEGLADLLQHVKPAQALQKWWEKRNNLGRQSA